MNQLVVDVETEIKRKIQRLNWDKSMKKLKSVEKYEEKIDEVERKLEIKKNRNI